MKIDYLKPVFVESFPRDAVDGHLYISIRFRTAMHLCCCGCGTEIVTPIKPTDWTLAYNGESVSLYPSIGNWSLPCRSHYWIRESYVEDAPDWSKKQVDENRAYDLLCKQAYFNSDKKLYENQEEIKHSFVRTLWNRIVKFLCLRS